MYISTLTHLLYVTYRYPGTYYLSSDYVLSHLTIASYIPVYTQNVNWRIEIQCPLGCVNKLEYFLTFESITRHSLRGSITCLSTVFFRWSYVLTAHSFTPHACKLFPQIDARRWLVKMWSKAVSCRTITAAHSLHCLISPDLLYIAFYLIHQLLL